MPELPDTTLVQLHRAPRSPVRIDRLDGQAWRIPEDGGPPGPLSAGEDISVGETVVLAAGARLEAGPVHLLGGARGQAHGLVSEGAFRPSPSRSDVPRLLLQLTQIQEQIGRDGEDPLAVRGGPQTPLERCASADFARRNLVLSAARELPEEVARSQGAVSLFVNEDTAFVALVDLSIAKLQALMETLERPINPHMVDPELLEELLDEVYAAGAA